MFSSPFTIQYSSSKKHLPHNFQHRQTLHPEGIFTLGAIIAKQAIKQDPVLQDNKPMSRGLFMNHFQNTEKIHSVRIQNDRVSRDVGGTTPCLSRKHYTISDKWLSYLFLITSSVGVRSTSGYNQFH